MPRDDARQSDRRCCHKGCTAVREAWVRKSLNGYGREFGWSERDGWYKCSVGFMSHACPEHRGPFEAYDTAERAHRVAFDKAHRAAYVAFEEQWERDNPSPTHPPMQASA